ncbi:hypothetical protein KKG52_03240 [Patescibacteria group bacterium]|nr:hypothetical protein [Patescibacteria group bacterium]
MILIKRRRLISWLFKAYIKKWGKQAIFFFVLGLIVFYLLLTGSKLIIDKIPFLEQERIGITGLYTADNLPGIVISKMSEGLTKISENGLPIPGAAKKWEIKDNGKTYIFYLADKKFNDGTRVTSKQINYNFLDVEVERPNDLTIIFKLKETYAPFLITTSRPIFKNGYIGISEFKVKSLNLNGTFVDTITLVSTKNKYKTIHYQVYPTEESLRTAFVLGEVSRAIGVYNTTFKNKELKNFKNTEIKKQIDFSKLVTIFYNTKDPVLSEKKLRTGLSYAIPDDFSEGLRNSTPFSPYSWASSTLTSFVQDLPHAESLILSTQSATGSGELSFTLKTLPKYENLAKKIQSTWKKIDINIEIEKVESRPNDFQIYLGDFNLPKDPDQYSLWHSEQVNNISNYKSLRIDKLLEDGRKNVQIEKRQKIYSDLQKYLLDDSPATFIYFPYTYDLIRK